MACVFFFFPRVSGPLDRSSRELFFGSAFLCDEPQLEKHPLQQCSDSVSSQFSLGIPSWLESLELQKMLKISSKSFHPPQRITPSLRKFFLLLRLSRR